MKCPSPALLNASMIFLAIRQVSSASLKAWFWSMKSGKLVILREVHSP
jgi:hypothetical protein